MSMKEIGAYEAKTKLSRLLQEVRGGERYLITHQGRPTAQLVPVPAPGREPRAVVAALRELRKDACGQGSPISIREARETGRT